MIFAGKVTLAAAGFALIATASAAPFQSAQAQEQKIPITKEVWAFYKEYEGNVTGAHSGFFAIAVDGSYATSIYCPDLRCRDTGKLRQKVISSCEEKSGVDCVLFAQNRDIKVEYELIDE
jgi:hypothetical protein